jgi:nucleoside-diphosphate-sugar epimerase
MLAMESERAVGQTISIGTGTPTSILDLAQKVKKVADMEKIPMIFSEERLRDIKKSLSSTARARVLLGFVPSVNLDEGLEEFVNWQKIIA